MIVNRFEWGAADAVRVESLAPLDPSRVDALVVHDLEQSAISMSSIHDDCLAWARDAQAADQAGGLPDIRWTAVICPHGSIFDGRGLSLRSGVGAWASHALDVLVMGDTEDAVRALADYWLAIVNPVFPGVVVLKLHSEMEEHTCPTPFWASTVEKLRSP